MCPKDDFRYVDNSGRRNGKWVKMRIGNKTALLRLLDSKLAMTLDIIMSEAKDDGIWISSEQSRVLIEKKVGISTPTYFRYIRRLCEKDILLDRPREGRGVYKLNPELIYKDV